MYILSESVKEGYIDDSICRFISPELHRSLKRSELKPRDIVITKTGVYFGRSAVIPDNFPCANTSAHVGKIKADESKINSYYLSTFLNSTYGYLQLRRRGIKATRPEIKLVEFDDILVVRPQEYFQETIEQVVRLSEKHRNSSRRIYQEAEGLLLSELGLKDWQPTEETVAVKSFAESFLSSSRLDAEYYQPKYDQLYRLLEETCLDKGWPLQELKNLSSLFKYGTSEPLEYIDKAVPFLRIADLQKCRFSEESIKYISKKDASLQTAIAQEGDVLISRSGTLGLATVIPDYLNGSIYGSYFILTRPDSTSIMPDYLAFYLNSLAGKLQTEQANTGGIQTNLTIPVLQSLRIACPPLSVQQKIVDKVNQSYDAEDNSKRLLEIAKTGVERAIEVDEESAIAWINQQLEDIGVALD